MLACLGGEGPEETPVLLMPQKSCLPPAPAWMEVASPRPVTSPTPSGSPPPTPQWHSSIAVSTVLYMKRSHMGQKSQLPHLLVL